MDYKKLTSKEEIENIKTKLTNIIDFANSEDYYKLSENKKSLINNLKVAAEIYINSLSSLFYTDDNTFSSSLAASNLFMPYIFSMFTNSSNFGGNNHPKDELTLDKVKEK